MSGTNRAAVAAEITLEELEGLIKRLGMLGSAHDGEVLAAAHFAVKWVREHGTDWRTLLTPPEEPTGVTVAVADNSEAKIQAAYRDGYAKGSRAMADAMTAQLRAQNAYSSPMGGLGAGLSGLNPNAQPRQGPAPQAASGASHGSWQAVAQELLDRHGSGIPGVLRSKEEQFLRDILARGFRTLTQPQDDWLRDIARRSAMSW